jgi:flavin-dependent dehydrogenase
MNVAIIGSGPAGSHLAHTLASAGARVRLYDMHRGAWEKPCGGGITAKALRQFGFLLEQDAAFPRQEIDEIEILSPRGRAVTFPLADAPFRILPLTVTAGGSRLTAMRGGRTFWSARTAAPAARDGNSSDACLTRIRRCAAGTTFPPPASGAR